jgi:hypothetical protein
MDIWCVILPQVVAVRTTPLRIRGIEQRAALHRLGEELLHLGAVRLHERQVERGPVGAIDLRELSRVEIGALPGEPAGVRDQHAHRHLADSAVMLP